MKQWLCSITSIKEAAMFKISKLSSGLGNQIVIGQLIVCHNSTKMFDVNENTNPVGSYG